MQLALWNSPPAGFIVAGLEAVGGRTSFEVERAAPEACVQALRAGMVDVALVPTLTVLRDPDAFDVIPAVGFSTWNYPYARLVLRHALDRAPARIVYHPADEQERHVAEIVLQEHYHMAPAFEALPDADVPALLAADADGILVVGNAVPTVQEAGYIMDIGQEWYELANYPMVWGLYAAQKGHATPQMIRALRAGAREAESRRGVWAQAQEASAAIHQFNTEDLRLRLDDLALASLTEFRQYLFYRDLLDDLAEIPFVFLPEEEEEGGDVPLV